MSDAWQNHLRAAGQEHLLTHAEQLDEGARDAFLASAAGLPWNELAGAFGKEGPRHSPALRPPVTLSLRRQMAEGPLRARVGRLGRGLLAGGRVATLLLAGGQGTRLGHPGPKGTVVFGPEEERTLYRIHAERIAAVSRWSGHPVPFYVLTSPQTDAETRAAFEDAEAWGLVPGQVRFLRQTTLPALDEQGRALLEAPGQLALAPDGHGGAFPTLVQAGAIAELRAAGVDVLTTFQVDNPLARPLDPMMLGWMVERRLEAIGKAVRKSTPEEKVGVFARDLRGALRVVEYSEMPPPPAGVNPAEGMDAPLDMGSIAIHGFALSFLDRLATAEVHLPLHRAHKRVPHLDADGTLVEPDTPNAWKLERFIFDLFPLATRAEVQEVKREWEFAPVKNATGVDSLLTARVMVAAEVRRWHEEQDLSFDGSGALRPGELDGGREYTGGPLR
jgi:UDP-N-acetylglucosamine/UDP-N-acetylgalactosamine diphosphorylase